MTTIKLHVLLFKEDGWWLAQCLDYDISARALTIPEVEQSMLETLEAHLRLNLDSGEPPFANLPPAPERFRNAYDRLARPIKTRDMKPFEIGSIMFSQPELRVA